MFRIEIIKTKNWKEEKSKQRKEPLYPLYDEEIVSNLSKLDKTYYSNIDMQSIGDGSK